MSWNWHFTWHILPSLLRALVTTIEASALASVLALLVGLIIAIARYSGGRWVSLPLRLVVDFLRGTPLLVQLYFLFYVLPLYHVTLSALVTGVIGLGLHFSAYTAEVYRAGLENVPQGQKDAVTVLGLPKLRGWVTVLLPQVIRPIGPALGNYVVAMFKESAVLSVITVNELLNQATNTGNLTYRYLEPITMAGVLYWIISYSAARLIRMWERRASY